MTIWSSWFWCQGIFKLGPLHPVFPSPEENCMKNEKATLTKQLKCFRNLQLFENTIEIVKVPVTENFLSIMKRNLLWNSKRLFKEQRRNSVNVTGALENGLFTWMNNRFHHLHSAVLLSLKKLSHNKIRGMLFPVTFSEEHAPSDPGRIIYHITFLLLKLGLDAVLEQWRV